MAQDYKPVKTSKVGGSPFTGVLGWIDDRLPLPRILLKEYVVFQVPRNLNYLYSFGGILMLSLITMIITGVILGMHYKADVNLAFDSVERIMRDVNHGWLIRYIHMNMASFFFIAVYIHMFRGLYYGSYKHPRELMWIFGIIIFLMMMATAFLGYVLPWGQMSFWGATVITNLFSAIPFAGDAIVTFLWGDFSVGDAFLNRAFVLHWLIAFGIVGVVIFHVIALHMTGSNNPSGVEPIDTRDTISFAPYMTQKDLVAAGAFLLVFCIMLFYLPNFLGHPDNYIRANPLQTPAHIVPEWYFLPFYAILRAIPDKLFGVLAMGGAIVSFAALPWLDRSYVRSCRYRPIWKWCVWIFVADFLVLMYCGAMPAEEPYVTISRIGTAYWFGFLFVLAPLVGKFETHKPLPQSIHQSMEKST